MGRRSWPLVMMWLGALAWPTVATTAPPEVPTEQRVEPGVAKEAGLFALTIMFPAEPTGDPLAVARRVIAQKTPGLVVLTSPQELPKETGKPLVILEMVGREAFTPPDLESLRYKGRGISESEAKAIQGATRALTLGFLAPHPHQHAVVRSASELAHAVVAETGGLIYDEETRELFGAEPWRDTRIGAFDGTVPEVVGHITIHAYRDGELYRAITLGMGKFGCPDVVVNQFPKSHWNSVGSVINLVAQSLVEGDRLPGDGTVDVSIDALKAKGLRSSLVESLEPGAKRAAALTYGAAPRQDGDPDNALMELTFGAAPGATHTERQSAVLSALFGASGTATQVRHEQDVMRASAAAQQRLVTVKKSLFLAGLPLGERLMVKGPFATPDGGREWMWVEVTGWEGKTIRGVLMNDPVEAPGLRAGAPVTVDETEAFDYLHDKGDGSTEGNETGKLFQRQR